MARKKTSDRSPRPAPEEEQATTVPEEEKPRRVLGPILYLCAGLVLLGMGVYGLITVTTLWIEEGSWAIPAAWIEFPAYVLFSVYFFSWSLESYNPALSSRIGAFLTAPLFLCGGLALTAYGVYGLATDNLLLLLPSRTHVGRGIFFSGPAAWVLFLAYLSFAVCVIASAVDAWDKRPDVAVYAKIEKATLILAFGCYVGSAIIASHFPNADFRALSANFTGRFTGDSNSRKILLEKKIAYDPKTFLKQIEQNDIETVKLFLDAGMYINTLLDANRYSALAVAAKKGHKDLVQLLLDRKADVDKRGETGWTPLQAAAISTPQAYYESDCYNDIVLLLIENGADVNAQTRNGDTALMMATQVVCPAAVRTLVENKADLNARAETGDSALLYAVRKTGHASVYDPEKRDKVDVLDQKSFDLVKYLLEHGADPNVKNSSGQTPLRIARSRKVEEVVELLEKYHARE